ncbi:hypothetical protein CBM2615_B140179 [Cupriavidus taiwanensis]|uniref:Uncharacterized protein n=1 Tax=Cupriavidus taiwanensis TaxID=164546 RepID=A0A375E5T3_9BURK|nr:hypothetical protein CBM2615_B140179 [Cupriavidus taiwanensis]SOZ68093.1 hypothetical protein CBM2613_B110179 [Cupriavidus taiwanensis]
MSAFIPAAVRQSDTVFFRGFDSVSLGSGPLRCLHRQWLVQRNHGCAYQKVRRYVARLPPGMMLPFAARAAYTTLTARACAPAPPARSCPLCRTARDSSRQSALVQGTRQASATENTTCLV